MIGKRTKIALCLSVLTIGIAGASAGITYAAYKSQVTITQTAGMNRYIFLDASNANWSANNAKFYMYAWASADGAHQWFPASATTSGGYYWFYIPSTYTGCLFVRADPNRTYAEVQGWTDAIWNQTENISFVNDKNVWAPSGTSGNNFVGSWTTNYTLSD